MGKRKDWVYTNANGQSIGLMKCCSCGKKITEGEFRYYETEEAYVCQCKKCGGSDNRWIERDRQLLAEEQKQWEEDAQTDHKVLLRRIKDAYLEGYTDADPGYEPCAEEEWENSEAKRVHDVLKALWGVQ